MCVCVFCRSAIKVHVTLRVISGDEQTAAFSLYFVFIKYISIISLIYRSFIPMKIERGRINNDEDGKKMIK